MISEKYLNKNGNMYVSCVPICLVIWAHMTDT